MKNLSCVKCYGERESVVCVCCVLEDFFEEWYLKWLLKDKKELFVESMGKSIWGRGNSLCKGF